MKKQDGIELHPVPHPGSDLTESSLERMLAEIYLSKDTFTADALTKFGLEVTAEGIAYMKLRYETEPDFKEKINAMAVSDPDYKAFLIEVGILVC